MKRKMFWALFVTSLIASGSFAGESVTVSSDPAATNPLIRGTQLKITCKYTTLNYKKSSLKWMQNGNEFTSTQEGSVSDGTAEGDLSVSIYTVAAIAVSDSRSYTCSAEYTDGGATSTVTSPTPVALTVLDVVMAINREAATNGDKVTVTCNYEQNTATGTPTITWFKDSVALTPTQQQHVSEGDNCGDTQRSRYVITSATIADTGKYKCKATYDIDRSNVDVEPNPSTGIDLNIRTLITTEASYLHVEVGGSLDIACTVTGDEPDSFKWLNSDGSPLVGVASEPSSYANNQKTSTLQITTATETNHQKSFKCEAKWSSVYEPKMLEKVVAVKVYDVTGIKDATTAKLSAGAEFSITCQFEATGATKVTWYRSGTKLKEEPPSGGVSELTYTIANVAGSDSGVYSCKVEYTGVATPYSYTGRQTKSLEVRGKSDAATTHASIGTASVTLTCVFYGDAMAMTAGAATQWFKDGSTTALATNAGELTVTPGAYSTESFSLTTTLNLETIVASDAAAYTCKTKYTSDNIETQSVQTLAILALPVITSSDATVSNASPVTLTCTFTAAPTGSTPTVTWEHDTTDITSKTEKASETTYTYSVAKVAPSDSGKYTCEVAYSGGYTTVKSAEFEQFVRDVAPGASSTSTVDGAASATLTCIFRGDTLGATTWTKSGVNGDLVTGEDYTIVPGTYSAETYLREDKLVILTVQAGDAGDYTCKASYVTGSKLTSSSQSLTVLGVTSMVSSNTKVSAFTAFTITCTHSVLDSRVEVTWSVNGQAITKGFAPDGNTKSVLTVSSAKKEDNGNYKCSVKFGSFGTAAKEITQYVRFAEAVATSTAISGDATHDITCMFYGDPLSPRVWKFGDTTLSDGSDYGIQTTTTDFSTKDVLTIKTVDATNDGIYKCSTQYTADSQDSYKEIRLTVYGITKFESSSGTVDSGSALTLTCDYSFMQLGGPPTIAWFKNDQGFTSGITAPSSTSSVFTVATSTKNNNGEYQCKVTFGNIGTAVSSKMTQYVRYVTPAQTVYGVKDRAIDISCTFYGDALGATAWHKDSSDTAISTGGQFTVTPGTYANQMRTDKLTISTLTTGNNGVYTCKASYTAGSKETSSAQTLSVITDSLTVTATRTPSDAAVNEGSTVTFTCTYTNKVLASGEGTISVAWKLNSEHLNNQQEFTTTADHSKNGEFKCVVTYGTLGELSGSNTLLVRSVQHTENVFAINGALVSLTCKAYGNEPTSITWNDQTKDYTKADSEVTDSAYANYYVESVFGIGSATTSKSYTCKVVYAAGAETTKTTSLKVLNAVAVPTLTADGEDATQTPTSGATLTLKVAFASITSSGMSHASASDNKITLHLMKTGTEAPLKLMEQEITDVGSTEHNFVLSNIETSSTGEYLVKAVYGSYGSVSSTPYHIWVRSRTEDSSKTVITGSEVVLSCKFEGDTVESYSWEVQGTSLSDGSDYEIPAVVWEASSNSLTTTLTIKSATESSAYVCKGTYTTGKTVASSTHTVTVLGVAMTSSEGSFSVSSGTTFTLTCIYSELDSGTTTITWFKDSLSIDNEVEYTIESKQADHVSLLKFSAEDSIPEKNGLYKCQALFGSVGSHSAEITQYVLSASVAKATTYTKLGTTVTLSCTFHGSLNTATSWYKDDTAILPDSRFTVIPGETSDFTRTDKLAITSTEVLDSATYKCSNQDSQAIQQLHIIDITTNPVNVKAEVGDTAVMSCVTPETKVLLKEADISWTSNSGSMDNTFVDLVSVAGSNAGFQVYTSSLTITGTAAVESNTYSCTVKPSPDDAFTVVSASASFYRIGLVSSAVTGYTGDYIESDQAEGEFSEQYTVTFNVYKGPGIESARLSFVDTSGVVEVVDHLTGTETDGVVPISYTPSYTDQKSGTVHLKVVYTGFFMLGDALEGPNLAVSVHSYCKVSSLPTVPHGSWSPATKVDFKGTATLTCEADYFSIGSVVKCEHNGEFKKTAEPNCVSKTLSICGSISDITNGYALYTGESSAKYQCNHGYLLQGPDLTYECDTTTKKWSVVTANYY
ncbi:hypothetical protein ACHWQZ_G009575 [Mnemiopsis leidyi]